MRINNINIGVIKAATLSLPLYLFTLLLFSCSDSDEALSEADLLHFDAVTLESDGSDVTAAAKFYSELSPLSAYGYVYTTDAEKDPTIADYILEGTVSNGRITVQQGSYIRNIDYREVSATFPSALLEQYGAVYARAFVTVYNGKTYYSDKIEVGTSQTAEALLQSYEAPTYLDNYTTANTAWTHRNQWNLANVHDPSVMLADDGYYYMYQTDASWGNVHEGHGHFMCRRSKDLVNWEFLGATMQECPSWCLEKLNEMRAEVGALPLSNVPDYGNGAWGYWAPVVRNLGNGTYRMYYSIVAPGYLFNATTSGWGERGMIGMMETQTPEDVTSWVDKGYVISSPSDRGVNWKVSPTNYGNCYFLYNAIDPSYIITPEGEHWLIYGSWHSGIVALQINAETGKPLNELGPWYGSSASAVSNYGKRIYSRVASGTWARWQGSEGPEIVYNPETQYYYLFLAYDGLDVPYNTRVLRSRNVDGPFLDITGADRTANPGDAYPVVTHPYHWTYSANTWVGFSHVAVFNDGKGQWFISSQARLTDPNANMLGHVRRLLWTEDGWPIAVPERYGNVPQAKITASEIRGTWDFIDITYEKDVAREGVTFEMRQTGKCTGGAFNGQAWSFDEEQQTLTIGSQKFLVTRECDYDSNPRRATICFCAYSSDGKHTYWGKRLW